MKKLLYLILFIPFALQAQTEVINVGTTANDGTGDKLRNAMIKINTNFSATRDSFGNIYREVQTRTLVNDSLTQLRTDALELSSIGFLKADTNTTLATKTDILNIEGGTGVSGKFYYLIGNVDDTGFPNSGDSTLLHTSFVGKHITVFREGQLQAQHSDNTGQDGFWMNNLTGELTFRPVLSAGEQLELWATNTIEWEALTAEGDAGAAQSVLLDSLIAYYSLDETTGNNSNDVVGNFDGSVYTSTVGAAAKVGLGVTIGSTGAIVIPYAAGLAPVADKMSFSLWVNTSTLPSVAGVPYRLFTLWDATMHITHSVYIYTDDKIWASFMNTTDDEYFVSSAGTVSNGTWYHIVAVCEGTGRTLKLYVNNVLATGNAFSGTLHAFDHSAVIGNEQNGYAVWLRGTIDEVGYWYQRLLPADVVLLYQGGSGRTYPFN